MAARNATAVRFEVPGSGSVSGLFAAPPDASACLVLAHGAGAGMTHSFMEAVASGLAVRGVATLRYQFPYMEAGSKRPDRPPVATACVRAAVEKAARLAPDLTLFAGGKSFGGRMTSQAAAGGLPSVRGLVFQGFPLHPAGKPSDARAAHLAGGAGAHAVHPRHARCAGRSRVIGSRRNTGKRPLVSTV